MGVCRDCTTAIIVQTRLSNASKKSAERFRDARESAERTLAAGGFPKLTLPTSR